MRQNATQSTDTKKGRKMLKRRPRAPRFSREQRELNLEKYWRDFYRRQYYGKLIGGAVMMVLMAIVSLVSHSLMPLYLMTPLVVVSLSLITLVWRKRIGLVAKV
jgi:hypothetical protein